MPGSISERVRDAFFGRYTAERELGAGGMAIVYLAHDVKHDRKVALKVLQPELAAVMGAERFLAEIRTTANLQHPHILPLFDSGEADGLLYYVMPYVKGESLRDCLDREGELSVADAVRIATAVSSALDYAHRHGVIHRDIKPANILLHDGEPLVADFGIALAVSAAGGERLTETGLSLGTPHYMSPEQATADRDPDARSDVYALGCVLYEMLTGTRPFEGHSAQAVLGRILTTDPVRPTEHRRTVPGHVESAVLKALEKRPADRFGSAADFGNALNSPGALARQLSPTVPLRPHLWRYLAIGLGIASVVLAVLTVRGWSVARQERALRTVQHIPLALRDPPRGRSPFGPGAELAPDGGSVAFQGMTGEWWIFELSDGTSRPLGIDGLTATFSPSGDSLAHTTSAYLQQLYLLDLATGRSTLLEDSVQGHPVWSRDGWVYYAMIPGIQRTRVSDGLRETVVKPEGAGSWYAKNPVPLPGGLGLLYTRIPLAPRDLAGAEIVALDMRNGQSRALTTGVDARYLDTGHLLIAQLDGSLLAAPFDVESLEITGSLTRVLDQLEIRQTEVGASLSIGRDGTLLYVTARDDPVDTVVVVDRIGAVSRRLPTWGGAFPYMSFSLAYRESDKRWAVSLHRGTSEPNVFVRAGDLADPRRLTFSWIVDYYPRFVPHSDDVAFVSPTVDRNWDLYRTPFDGSGAATLLLDRPGDIHAPRFSADGRWVVFCEADRAGQRDVLAHRFQPDSITVILAGTNARECDPDLSPDGRWLVYTSDESGSIQVWVRGFVGNTDSRWQVTRDGGTSPRWGRSGRELFYVSPNQELIAVPVTLGSSFSWGSGQPLFQLKDGWAWTGEVASGEQEFIVIQRHREAPGQVVLIRNFPDLVLDRVGR